MDLILGDFGKRRTNMRTVLFSSIMAIGLLATPALAQSSNQGGDQKQGQSASSSSQQMTQMQAMSQDRLTKSLEQAGFKNITVVDATYLVQAQGPHGDRVTMLIDPPTVGGTSGGSGGGSANASSGGGGSGQQGQGGSSTQQQ